MAGKRVTNPAECPKQSLASHQVHLLAFLLGGGGCGLRVRFVTGGWLLTPTRDNLLARGGVFLIFERRCVRRY